MSLLEQFEEFRKQLKETLNEMYADPVRYPRFRTDYCIRMQRQRNRSKDRCCIAAKLRTGWQRCNRRRSQRVLTRVLEKLAVHKKLNIAISDEDPHHGICLLHWRLIKYGRPGGQMTQEEVQTWDAPESRLEKAERDDEFENEGCAGDSSVSSDPYSGDEDVGEKKEPDYKAALKWKNRIKPYKDEIREGEQQRESDDEEDNGLSSLSAASLRRYRKFFMIPTKASASKHAMLEGVENHFEALPVQANDTIAHFIYTAKNRMNTVE
ncbi:unnamed protein product [Nippostrongylus brasiliensis]|uniref:SAP30_Sin3_bdg domain-containing protein n=1 Tax=Nippostrongylus brasiliensis TaxID=27835 RepID=A0A0N4XC84_NIPBR|nr:unnamed protein product [Nippostrongylus brasiliensis]